MGSRELCVSSVEWIASFNGMKRVASRLWHRPMTVSVGLLSLVAVIRAWLQWVGSLPGDRYAAAHFTTAWTEADVVRRVTSFFSVLGTPFIAAALVCLGLLVLWVRTDMRTAYGLAVACIVIPLNALLKLVSGPTPLWSETHTYHVGRNFPSGHVAFVASVVGYLGWVAVRRDQPAAAVVALAVIVGMGPARVLAGAHLVSDVIAGYLVGGAVLVLAVAVAGGEPVGATQAP
jgi:membrane-associated phospholipid phosphatase